LISAVRSAVHFQASRAGLEEESCENFAIASEDVCKEALTRLTGADGGLDVTLDTFPVAWKFPSIIGGQLTPAVGPRDFALPARVQTGLAE